MTRTTFVFLVALVLPITLRGQDPTIPPEPSAPACDYGELSKIIHGLVVKSVPKQFEDSSEWGKSTPFPQKLRLPGLARTTIKVGDHLELAHGTWKKTRAWLVNPDKDITIQVTELKPMEGSKYRLALVANANLIGEQDIQQWLNGLMIVSVTGRATTKVQIDLDCDIALSLNIAKFPPEVTVDPKIARCAIAIKEFELFKPSEAKRPDRAENINNELKNVLQGLITSKEPQIKDEANRAIAQALRDGKGTFSASALYEAIGKTKK